MEGLVAVVFSGMALACLFNPERSVDKPVPPPMATTRRGLFTALVPSQCLPSLLIGIARFRIVWSFPELWRLRIRRTVVSRCGSTVDVWAFLPLLRRPEPNQDLPPQKPGHILSSEGIPRHRDDKEIRFARADNPALRNNTYSRLHNPPVKCNLRFFSKAGLYSHPLPDCKMPLLRTSARGDSPAHHHPALAN
jgi:hypothetical protein